jgi:hypothetical protein
MSQTEKQETTPAKRRRARRKLVIEVRTPDEKGFRLRVTGDDLTVSAESLDAWVPVCERIMAIVTEHFVKEKKP